jgi:hypothetical protein
MQDVLGFVEKNIARLLHPLLVLTQFCNFIYAQEAIYHKQTRAYAMHDTLSEDVAICRQIIIENANDDMLFVEDYSNSEYGNNVTYCVLQNWLESIWDRAAKDVLSDDVVYIWTHPDEIDDMIHRVNEAESIRVSYNVQLHALDRVMDTVRTLFNAKLNPLDFIMCNNMARVASESEGVLIEGQSSWWWLYQVTTSSIKNLFEILQSFYTQVCPMMLHVKAV